MCVDWTLACFLCSLFSVKLFIGVVSKELHLPFWILFWCGCECAFEYGFCVVSRILKGCGRMWMCFWSWTCIWVCFQWNVMRSLQLQIDQNTIDAGLHMWRVMLLIPADEIPLVHVTTRLLTSESCLFAYSSESHHKDSNLSQISHKFMWNGLRPILNMSA